MSEHLTQTDETDPSLIAKERPGFYDLLDNAEAGIVKRGLTRYFFTHNYERSIKLHEAIGTPLIKKVVMGTLGRMAPPCTGGNYRLNANTIEAVTTFAVDGSVFNEIVHTIAATPASCVVAFGIAESRYDTLLLANALGAGFNLGLVALQRYSRARMIRHADKQLARGATYAVDYENWLGIDARAVENYQEGFAQNSLKPAPITHQSDDNLVALPSPEIA